MAISVVDRNRQMRAIREDVREKFGARYEEIMVGIRESVAAKAAEAGVTPLHYAAFVYDSVRAEDDPVSIIGAEAIISAALDLSDTTVEAIA